MGLPKSSIVTLSGTQVLQNKSFADSTDNTKILDFDLSGATTGKKTTFDLNHTDDRILTLPNVTDTIVNLNNVPQGVEILDVKTSATYNSSSETDLYTYTIPAGKLATNGDCIEMTVAMESVYSTGYSGSKTYNIFGRFGGTAVSQSNNLSILMTNNVTNSINRSYAMFVKVIVIRTGAASQVVTAILTAGQDRGYAGKAVTSHSTTGTIIIKVTGQNTTDTQSGIVGVLGGNVTYYPAG